MTLSVGESTIASTRAEEEHGSGGRFNQGAAAGTRRVVPGYCGDAAGNLHRDGLLTCRRTTRLPMCGLR